MENKSIESAVRGFLEKWKPHFTCHAYSRENGKDADSTDEMLFCFVARASKEGKEWRDLVVILERTPETHLKIFQVNNESVDYESLFAVPWPDLESVFVENAVGKTTVYEGEIPSDGELHGFVGAFWEEMRERALECDRKLKAREDEKVVCELNKLAMGEKDFAARHDFSWLLETLPSAQDVSEGRTLGDKCKFLDEFKASLMKKGKNARKWMDSASWFYDLYEECLAAVLCGKNKLVTRISFYLESEKEELEKLCFLVRSKGFTLMLDNRRVETHSAYHWRKYEKWKLAVYRGILRWA